MSLFDSTLKLPQVKKPVEELLHVITLSILAWTNPV